MEEPFSHARMVTVAHDGYHVPAVVAEMLYGLPSDHVSLVCEKDRQSEDEDSNQ